MQILHGITHRSDIKSSRRFCSARPFHSHFVVLTESSSMPTLFRYASPEKSTEHGKSIKEPVAVCVCESLLHDLRLDLGDFESYYSSIREIVTSKPC